MLEVLILYQFWQSPISLPIYIKPSNNALNIPLQKRFPASDLSDPLVPPHGRGKWHTMVMMFVGGLVSVVNGIHVLFVLYRSYGVGVFHIPVRTLIG
jgi:hypothetical protein